MSHYTTTLNVYTKRAYINTVIIRNLPTMEQKYGREGENWQGVLLSESLRDLLIVMWQFCTRPKSSWLYTELIFTGDESNQGYMWTENAPSTSIPFHTEN